MLGCVCFTPIMPRQLAGCLGTSQVDQTTLQTVRISPPLVCTATHVWQRLECHVIGAQQSAFLDCFVLLKTVKQLAGGDVVGKHFSTDLSSLNSYAAVPFSSTLILHADPLGKGCSMHCLSSWGEVQACVINRQPRNQRQSAIILLLSPQPSFQ